MAAGILSAPEHGLSGSFYAQNHALPYVFAGMLMAAVFVLLIMIPKANGRTLQGEALFLIGTTPLFIYVAAAWLVVLFNVFDTSQRSFALLSIYTGFLLLLIRLWYTERVQ